MNMLAIKIKTAGLTGTATEVRTALGLSFAMPYNTERWTYDGVALMFGAAAAEGLGAAMRGAGLEMAAIRYATIGFELHIDETQNNLTALANAVPQLTDVCNALKAIGRPVVPRWESLGLSSLPSLEDVQTALNLLNSEAWVVNLINEILNPSVNEGKSVEEIKALVAGA